MSDAAQRSSPGSLELRQSDAEEALFLEENIATVAWHLGQPGAKLSVRSDKDALMVDPGDVLKEISRRLTAPAQGAVPCGEPRAYWVEHPTFGIELSLDRPSEHAVERGWVGTPLYASPAPSWQPMTSAPRDGTICDLWLIGGGRVTDQWWVDEDKTWCGLEEEMFSHWIVAPVSGPSLTSTEQK